MKRLFFLICIAGFVVSGFAQNKVKSTSTSPATVTPQRTTVLLNKIKNLPKSAAASQGEVSKMANRYLEIIKKNPERAIKQVNLDAVELNDLLLGVSGLKLIFTADDKDKISVYLQFWRADGPSYNNIYILKDDEAVCPSSSAACEPDLPKSANRDVLHEYMAMNEANRYIELVMNKAIDPILQINMDALVLKSHLFRTKRLQLICAVNENQPTVIMQFWKDGLFYYYDINDFFNLHMSRMRGKGPVLTSPAVM